MGKAKNTATISDMSSINRNSEESHLGNIDAFQNLIQGDFVNNNDLDFTSMFEYETSFENFLHGMKM
jgi:hypothetical protein